MATGAVLGLFAHTAMAGPVVWTVDSAATSAYAELVGLDGRVVSQVSLGSDLDPRGIAIVGGTGYVSGQLQGATSSQGGVIRSFDVATGAILNTVATSPLLGSLSYDGGGFWASDNGGGNLAFHVTLSGVTDRTVALSNCGGSCSGLDYFTRNGASYLIANRGPADALAAYDLYTLNGALVTVGLIVDVPYGTGIGYNPDTQGFVVASSSGNDGDLGSFLNYGSDGMLQYTTQLGGPVPDSGFGTNVRFLNDVSVVPEPASLFLVASCLGVAGLVRRRA